MQVKYVCAKILDADKYEIYILKIWDAYKHVKK